MKGKNERENLFKKLGLGGYYFITEIENTIENSVFTTNIIARWNAYGDGTLNVGDRKIGQDISMNNPNTQVGRVEIVL